MNYIKNIRIANFRGFDNLQIKDFKQINVFVGKNNSGKSSILEAIFLIAGMSNPNLSLNINKFRGYGIKVADDFKYLFHKLNFKNVPEFKSSFENQSERTLKLIPLFKKQDLEDSYTAQKNGNSDTINASTSIPLINGLKLDFTTKEPNAQKQSFASSIYINPPEIQHNFNNNYKENLHAVFIAGDHKETNTLARYSEIVKRKKEHIVLKALKKIDPKIESIHALPDGLFFNYNGIDELIPINISGDGVRRYLNIVTTIAEKTNSIILIDEIENGLHYTAHKLLWKSIFNIATEFKAQLFISTHSIETLNCLKALMDEDSGTKIQNSLNIYNITHTTQAGIKSYKYSFEGLKDAIETNTEIR